MIVWLILLFTLLPLVELTLLVQMGIWLGGWVPVIMVIVTGTVGAALARWQGLSVWTRIQRDMQNGILPADGFLDGLMILLAGAVLITPGILTDTVGFLLLMPPCRRFARNAVKARLRRRFQEGSFQVHTTWEDSSEHSQWDRDVTEDWDSSQDE